jgi:hypothetical protein
MLLYSWYIAPLGIIERNILYQLYGHIARAIAPVSSYFKGIIAVSALIACILAALGDVRVAKIAQFACFSRLDRLTTQCVNRFSEMHPGGIQLGYT